MSITTCAHTSHSEADRECKSVAIATNTLGSNKSHQPSVCEQQRLLHRARKIESAIAYLAYTISIDNSSGKPHNAFHFPSIPYLFQ